MDRNSNSCSKPALWGGLECTINRVGNKFRDQLELAGHYSRPDDIRQFGKLGFAKMRYPVLWERHAPTLQQPIDWSFTASRLEDLAEQHIDPIVGLVHHGSGPAYTNLLDPDFGARLAEYAFAVSSRFPFVSDYTPVNEPLTTARFSGLYGFWYPHHRDDVSFARMLLNQLKATVLSMQAIRAVNPGACLIQTEDLGKTHSTAELAYQADFENHRRWLTFDILCGRFDEIHPLWNWFVETLRIPEKDLAFFLDHPCTPDVFGLNYYVTSERWIDGKLENYPESTHGGNQIQRYADTEVVRARPKLRRGAFELGKEVWDRYNKPLAFTEVHLHCTREEQMRWWTEMREAADSLCRTGVPVVGVTAWSLLGAFDWDSLLTEAAGHYESGVFVIGNQNIRTTALASLISGGSGTGVPAPLLEVKGWWHGSQPLSNDARLPCLSISGPDGPVAEAFEQACRVRGIRMSRFTGSIPLLPDAGKNNSYNCWSSLSYTDGPAHRFSTGAMELTVYREMPVLTLVNHVLDLVIDAVSGTWEIGHTSVPDYTGELSERTAATV